MTRRVRIDLAYDGTAYHGWQVQPAVTTVQGILEEALFRVCGGTPVKTRGAGRTDAGAHARGQVADVAVPDRVLDAELERGLRALLPPDVRPLAVATAPPGFDARRWATGKTYRYTVDRTPSGDPFLARFALHHPHPLDERAVRDALSRLPGRRDFSGFASAACEVDDRVRTLSEASLETRSRTWRLTFSADGFLTYMVRNLVGTLLEVGRGALAPVAIDRILATGDRALGGPTAPAKGLCLERVDYPSATEGA